MLSRRGPRPFKDHLGHVGLTDGPQRIVADVEAAELQQRGAHQANHAFLGCGVVALAETADQTGGGDDLNDVAAACLAHRQGCLLGAEKGAAQMHLDDGVPLRNSHFEQGAVAHDAGVVDHHVNAAEALHASLHQGFGDCGFRHGTWNRGHVAAAGANRFGGFIERGFVGAVDDDRSAFGRRRGGKAPAKAPGRTRYHHAFSG